MDKFSSVFSNNRILLLLDKIQLKTEKVALSLLMIIISTVLILNILLSSIFGISLYWATELAQYLTVWMIFIGSSTLIRLNEHVNLDFILRFLSEKGQLILQIFIYLVAILFLIYLFNVGLVMTLEIFSKGQTGSNFRISMGWVYLSFPVGALLMAINSIKVLSLRIIELKEIGVIKD